MQSEKRELKAGLVGAGYISDAHARAIHATSGVRVHAIFDPSPRQAEMVAKSHAITHVCLSLDELLASGVDVVHVLSPPDSHYEIARQVIEAGLHVFIEKPMALTAFHCRDLTALAAKKGVALGINHNFLFQRGYEQLREMVRSGEIGRPDQVTINWMSHLGLVKAGPFGNWMLREPKNLFLEIGSHLCAFALDLVGEPRELQIKVSRPLRIPGGTTVYRRWHIYAQSGDTALDINLSVSPGIEDKSLTVHCHAATARVDYGRDVVTIEKSAGAGAHFGDFTNAERNAWQYAKAGIRNFARSMSGKIRKAPTATPFLDSVARSVAAFYRSVDGVPDPRIDGKFATTVIEMCESIAASIPAHTECATNRAEARNVPTRERPTVLVFGATGFIGKLLVRKLVAGGLGVRVATRSRGSAETALEGLAVDIMQGRLSDSNFLERAMHGIEVVYHLAKVEAKTWHDYFEQDVLVTRVIGEAAVKAGVKRFIYTGTIDSYYSGRAGETITSDTPLDPKIQSRNFYARSKTACEQELFKLHREQGLPVVVLRPGIVIGNGGPPGHWGIGLFESDTHVKYWGTGENLLPLVLVDDVVDALVLAMRAAGIEGQALLVTDKPMLSARDYVALVSKEMRVSIHARAFPIWRHYMHDWVREFVKNLVKHPHRRKPSFRDWDSRSQRAGFDSTKTQQVLGWRPVGDRQLLIDRGIVEPVREFMR